jgi:hypothetical protein
MSLGAIIALVLGVRGVAYATIPGPGGVISGCYSKLTGALWVIDASKQTCPSCQVPISWSETGPQGPPGFATTTVVSQQPPLPNGVETSVEVAWPAGDIAISGGWNLRNGDGSDIPGLDLNRSLSDADYAGGEAGSWDFSAYNGSGEDIPSRAATFSVVCAS